MEGEIDLVPFRLHEGNRELDRAFLGELHRVCQDIHKDLLDADHVAVETVRGVRVILGRYGQALPLSRRRDHIHEVVHQGGEGVLDRNDLQLSGLDLREVQNVVYQGKKAVPGRLDVLCVVENFFVARLPENHLVHAQDGIDGGPEFVGDIRKEEGLLLIGRPLDLHGVSKVPLPLLGAQGRVLIAGF